MRSGRQEGFSAIEALAALAVLAIAAVPLLELQSRGAQTAIRLQRTTGAMTAERSALAFMQVLNPTRDPEGTLPMGDFELRWRVVETVRERPAYNRDGSPGRFAMQLHVVEYQVAGPGRPGRPARILKMGWRATEPVLGSSEAGAF